MFGTIVDMHALSHGTGLAQVPDTEDYGKSGKREEGVMSIG
jgi:hypothetical protein